MVGDSYGSLITSLRASPNFCSLSSDSSEGDSVRKGFQTFNRIEDQVHITLRHRRAGTGLATEAEGSRAEDARRNMATALTAEHALAVSWT